MDARSAGKGRTEPGLKTPGIRTKAQPGGELALIERIRRRADTLPRTAAVTLGIGDDCAILRPRAGEEIVVTTDMSLEGKHFRRDWHPPEAIGHRLLARGLSDLAAMGAKPVAAFLSLALPSRLARDTVWLDRLLDGFTRLAQATGTPLAGGDTSQSPTDHMLADIVLLGAVPAGEGLRRDAARPGDRLFVTGHLGGAAAELESLSRRPGRRRGPAAESQEAEPNPHPHLFPAPRLVVAQTLRRRKLAHAAMDLSDGLSTDLRHLCAASGVTAVVQAARLPLHPLAVTGRSPEQALALALNGGEDYELLFTAAPSARVPAAIGGVPLTEIGRIEATGRGRPAVTLETADDRRKPLPAGGWEHLR